MSITKLGMARTELHRSLLEWLNAGGTVLDVVEAVESMIDNKIFVRFGNEARAAEIGLSEVHPVPMPRGNLPNSLGIDWHCEFERLRMKSEAEILDLREQVAALESREVCARAHDNVDTCGYCQRDALQRDIETGFMEGAYARLKNLQDAEAKLDAYMMAESLAVSHIRTLNAALRRYGQHLPSCIAQYPVKCTCGLFEAQGLTAAGVAPDSQAQRPGVANE